MPLPTTVTILRRGFSSLDRGLLPRDEMEARWRAVQELLAQERLAAVVAFGDADDYADTAYLSGLHDGSTVVLEETREPTVVGSGIWRELPVMRQQTWVRDVRADAEHGTLADALRALVGGRSLAGRRVGVVGLGRSQPPALAAQARAGLADCELVSIDAQLAALRATLRPREVTLVATATAIARAAAAAAAERFAGGEPGAVADACVAAERRARVLRARDVRLLVDGPDGHLRPAVPDVARRERLALYVAVDYQGYWGEAVVADGDREVDRAARAAVDAMARALRPWVAVGELADAALAALPPALRAAAADYGFGGLLGLVPLDEPRIATGAAGRLQAGAVVALRAVVPAPDGAAIACAALELTGDGARALRPAPPVHEREDPS